MPVCDVVLGHRRPWRLHGGPTTILWRWKKPTTSRRVTCVSMKSHDLSRVVIRIKLCVGVVSITFITLRVRFSGQVKLCETDVCRWWTNAYGLILSYVLSLLHFAVCLLATGMFDDFVSRCFIARIISTIVCTPCAARPVKFRLIFNLTKGQWIKYPRRPPLTRVQVGIRERYYDTIWHFLLRPTVLTTCEHRTPHKY